MIVGMVKGTPWDYVVPRGGVPSKIPSPLSLTIRNVCVISGIWSRPNGATVSSKKSWQGLCDQAATEQDSKKLEALIEELLRLLQENRDRFRKPTEPTKER
jgi:hypothetical protein